MQELAAPSGLRITSPIERLLRFCREEYDYYDGIADLEPNRILPQDVLVTVAVNSFVTSAAAVRAVHRGLQSTCENLLPTIPVAAHIGDYDPDCSQLHALLDAAVQSRGVLVAVATKVLHRKRPHWLPMLDSVVCKHYLDSTGRQSLLPWLQDKKRAAAAAVEVFRGFRDDIQVITPALEEIREALARDGFALSLVRIWEILLWSEVEPQGYYRR